MCYCGISYEVIYIVIVCCVYKMALVDKYSTASFKSSFLPKKASFEIAGVEKIDAVSVTSQLEPEIPQLARGVNVRALLTIITSTSAWSVYCVRFCHYRQIYYKNDVFLLSNLDRRGIYSVCPFTVYVT